jgi:hypothetical protein
VPEEYRDECCPKPTQAILDTEKKRKNAKSKQKRHDKKEKEGKLKLSAPSPQIVGAPQILVATTRTEASSNDPEELTTHGNSNDETTPPSPSKRSREDAGLELANC